VADFGGGEVAQLAVADDGALSPLLGSPLAATLPRRLTMTPDGTSLYVTAGGPWHGVVLQYDVGADGAATPKDPVAVAAGKWPSAIAADPLGRAVYVADKGGNDVLQFTVGAGGSLGPPVILELPGPPAGIALSPNGLNAYVIVGSSIKRYAVGAGGELNEATMEVVRTGGTLTDIALTPDGRRLYASSSDAQIFAFSVGAGGALSALGSTEPAAGCTKLTAIAIAPDGGALYAVGDSWGERGRRLVQYAIGDDGNLSALDPPSLPLADHPRDLALTPSGRNLYVAARDLQLFDLDASGLASPKSPAAIDLTSAVGVVVSPNQAPVARFDVSIAPAGSAVSFDAGTASDPDGSITRYEWDFDDGTTLATDQPQVSHVYAAPGEYEVRLVVTDNEGASTQTVFTGSSVLGNGAPTAETSRVIRIAAAAVPFVPPPVTPLAPVQPPRPELGETIIVEPAGGRVRVRVPGATSFVRLRTLRVMPVGSLIDARRGKALLSSVRDRSGLVQQGRFFDGVFQVRQRRSTRYITDLVLRGELTGCPSRTQASAARRRTRRLWGNARGRFRTRGRYSSGAVRGTRWLVADSCEGTLTVVRRGEVTVRDFTLDRRIVVEAGERYLARPE
jgi:DNA-binding beta-propeller fold protein YncE